MGDGGKLSSYRHGDNAESFGVSLLRGICAVAEVPRQEDWGVFDAVATLLRTEGKFLFAESSFLVQIKSAGQKKLHLTKRQVDAIREQELDFFFATVDLSKSAIRLYTMGPALSRLLFNQQSSLTIDFAASDKEKGNVWNKDLGPPILEWTGPLPSKAFKKRAHGVLKAWLDYNRRNRLQRPLGRAEMVTWETNEFPKTGGISARTTQDPEDSAMSLVLPALHWISMRVMDNPEMSDSLLKIYHWISARGASVGMDASFLEIRQRGRQTKEKIAAALAMNPDADFGMVVFSAVAKKDGNVAFTVSQGDVFVPTEGTLSELVEKGFILGPDPITGELTILDVTQPYFKPGRVFLRLHDCVILGKRLPSGGSGTDQ